jgi:cytochrome b
MSLPTTEVKVWDAWVRLFHWLLVVLVMVLFVTGNIGGNWLEWHKLAGFTVLGLVIFRVIWGFAGSHHARFTSFVRGPGTVIGYMKAMLSGNAERHLGHNPMGALSVVALLLVLGVQAVTGLFANDDIMLEGPYASLVSKATSDFVTKIHHINSKILIALAVLHMLAIGYYFFAKKENLVKAMVTGRKSFDGETPSIARPAWLAPLIAVLVAIAVYLIVRK